MRVTSGNIEAACAGYCWVMVSKTKGSTPLIQEFVLENEDTFAATGASLSFVPMLAVVTHLFVPGAVRSFLRRPCGCILECCQLSRLVWQ
jgi:hypothetical protein